ELLGLPLLSFARKLTAEGKTAQIHRQTDEGYDIVEAPLPAVVTVTGGINEARYPSLRGIMQSKNKEVKALSLKDLGLEGKVGKAGEVVEDKGDGAKRIADFLAGAKVI